MNPAHLSLAQLGMNDEGPIALIEAAADAGFGAVGLPLRSGALRKLKVDIVGNAPLVREIVAACRDTDVTVFDVEALVLGHLPEMEALKQTLETAAMLGASRISCLGFEPDHGPGDIPPEGDAGKLAEICTLAAQFGLRVGVEFMAFRSIGSLAAAVDIVERSGAQNAGIVLDALHVQRTGAGSSDIAALKPGIVSHLQICDASAVSPAQKDLADEARGARLLPGEGVVPLAAIIAALPLGTAMSLEIPVAALAGIPVRERARIGAASVAWL